MFQFLDNQEIHEMCFALDNIEETEVDDIYYDIFNTTQTSIEFNGLISKKS